MSKTATIKLRLTAEEKANWEAQAEADATTLSSLIRRRMNHPTTRADGVLDRPGDQGADVPDGYCCAAGFRCAPEPCPWHAELRGDSPEPRPVTDAQLVDALKARSRRNAQCEHGRPQYVYCPTCD